VIGPTENALRTLLRAVLSATPIESYDEWVAINVVDRHHESGEDVLRAVAAPLAIGPANAHAVLDTLVAKGLLASDGLSWTVSDGGAVELVEARASVAAVTAHLVEGLPATEIDATLRVLDHIRSRAEHELALRT
jgi:hypothetical protein